jgi:hypothetical protein
MTGGTTARAGTSDGVVLTFKSAQDVETEERIYRHLRDALSPRPLILHLVNLGHGLDPSGARDGCFQVPLERPHNLATILTLLRRRFRFDGYTERIQTVAGPLRLLKALTTLLMERGVQGTEFAVSLVASSSNHLSRRWRTLLESYWGAAVDDVYGLSEVPGLHARRCVACGHFHFSPLAVTEVLSLDDDTRVDAGAGRLVATSLYPLAALQPIIRYDTGDVIEYADHCAEAGLEGFEFLGRLSECVVVRRSAGAVVVLAPIPLNEYLESFAEVACHQHTFATILGINAPIGPPRWRLRSEPRGNTLCISLDIQLLWVPDHFPGAADQLQQRLMRGFDDFPDLAQSRRQGEIVLGIRLRGPGAFAQEHRT